MVSGSNCLGGGRSPILLLPRVQISIFSRDRNLGECNRWFFGGFQAISAIPSVCPPPYCPWSSLQKHLILPKFSHAVADITTFHIFQFSISLSRVEQTEGISLILIFTRGITTLVQINWIQSRALYNPLIKWEWKRKVPKCSRHGSHTFFKNHPR